MKLASIQTITEIRPIEGADRIEAATVLGYQTVIKRGEFRPGDKCVWHEPDTVAAEKPEYEFLRKQGFRLKVSRFKGQVSQGLALPLSVLPPMDYTVGDDVTDATGIRKSESKQSDKSSHGNYLIGYPCHNHASASGNVSSFTRPSQCRDSFENTNR